MTELYTASDITWTFDLVDVVKVTEIMQSSRAASLLFHNHRGLRGPSDPASLLEKKNACRKSCIDRGAI